MPYRTSRKPFSAPKAISRSAAPSNVRCAVLNKEAQLTTMLILASAIAFVGWGVVAPLLPVLPLST